LRAVQPLRSSVESTAQITIDPRSFHAVVRLPVDEIDLLLRLDRDLDGHVTAEELQAASGNVRAYIAKHIHVAADGTPVPLSAGDVRLSPPVTPASHIETAIDGRAASRIGVVSIDADFLTELSSVHKTTAEIRIGDRAVTFVFQRGVVYQRRGTVDLVTSALLVGGGLLVIGVLWFARRRRVGMTCLAVILIAAAAWADVIMSAPALNATLKTMEKLTRQAEAETAGDRADALFQLGAEADALASLMNLEVESHGMQERELLDLALSRTKELGIAIAYNRDKKKFVYDGAAFTAYLAASPSGTHAAAAAFKLLSYQFYQLSPADIVALTSAAEATKRFLARHPTFAANSEVRLYLAVDYRDLHRRYLEAHDEANATKYRQLAREECRRIARLYPRTDQADAARQLLQGLK
jgi:hypothetical protein